MTDGALGQVPAACRWQISARLRERHESGVQVERIDRRAITQILSSLPSHGVSDKQLILLRWLELNTAYPGGSVELVSERDYPVAWAQNATEFRYLLNALRERKFAIGQDDGWAILPAGWAHLDEHRGHSALSDQAFVAMAFAEELLEAWKVGLQPAIERCGYRAFRMDTVANIERVDVRIMAEIKRSRFVVADVTNHRPGVYFEAGYAIGLGIPVIWSVRRDQIDDVHFDTRQYGHILWTTPEELAGKLADTIVVNVGSLVDKKSQE